MTNILPGEVTPTLFVGLGGSGGRAIGRIARHLRARADFGVRYEGLVRFLAIDTNEADLARLRQGPGAIHSTVAISDFDKVEYSSLRRGDRFADADPYFTQWVHPWYRFREESGAGAGQIRVESRLSFNRAVEVGSLSARLSEILDALRHHAQGMRRHDAPVQVFVYFSVAGGTGSGAFLPFGYLVRDALGDKRSRVFGFAILPEAFEVVAGRNRDGVYANGYAALKELEHLMRLDTNTSGSPDAIAFHYDPRNKSRKTVARRPYDLVYLVDRPASFSLDEVGEALADASYLQVFSPILGDQQADYDNYTKESRALFPAELGSDGYSAFYGTLGSALVILPRKDLLEYCARRWSAAAVRRYLLLDDPALVSESQRERFKRFALDPAELDTLSPDERARRVDQSFVSRIDLLAEEDREGGIWKRIVALKETAGAKIAATLHGIETELRGKTTQVREISADRILDGSWTPANTIGALGREVEKARADVQARLGTVLAQIDGGSFWPELLAKAGPDGAPELSPYEQRYVLTMLREPTGLLGSAALDEVTRQIAGLTKECELGREGRFTSEMDAHASTLKRTHGGFDAVVLRKDKDFEAARDRAVATFNEQVERQRALLLKSALHELRVALGRAADALRASFRNIEASASRLSVELDEKARRFELDGGHAGAGEVNDFALDVEALQHPSGKQRFWSWYYLDQVARGSLGAAGPETGDSKEIVAAVQDAMRPRFDERGRPVSRTAREMVSDIERKLVEVAEGVLAKVILGDPRSDDPAERAGLTLDQAIALEAKYYELHTQNEVLAERERKKTTAEAALRAMSPLSPASLWGEENVRQYALRKLRATIGKAQPLTRLSPEARSLMKHTDMLLVGVHTSLAGSALGRLLAGATEGLSAQTIDDWPDAERLVFYRSILGVPLYCFPHVNEEMKACYQRYQAQREKAWPLHIDANWEALPDLDPEERRAAIESRRKQLKGALGALAIAVTRGAVTSGESGLELVIGSSRLPLGRGPIEAAGALAALEQSKPSIFQSVVLPLRSAFESGTAKGEVAGAQKTWSERAMQLELLAGLDSAQKREYDELREVAAILGG
ncbi:tubulin-like doman-containing protein [Sandaracinus amylolyticus]|uniref:tubulin-like doman-containing protein n=1 Tax=Sandaracinus amylolyticus TaxID=927083 RepID=UPI001F2B13F1|nr:tubulin-like doman-containing protein [Sandaracinus amylolyticus]UJR82252.1 Hypothetical protein I5071_43170 [Sandaracinus amylolyticus]